MDKDKLKAQVSTEITEYFEKTLDFAEVAIPSPETYRRFRSKVLRIGNNCIRALHKYIDEQDGDVTECGCKQYDDTMQCAVCRPCVAIEFPEDQLNSTKEIETLCYNLQQTDNYLLTTSYTCRYKSNQSTILRSSLCKRGWVVLD